MKKFNFRLQKLMDAKQGEERQKQRELGFEQSKLSEEEERLGKLDKDRQEADSGQRKLIGSSAKVSDLLVQHFWQRTLDKKIRVQEEVVDEQEQQVEDARERLVEVSREKKLLEKLRERRFNEHKVQNDRSQQNQLDDIAARKRDENSGGEERP